MGLCESPTKDPNANDNTAPDIDRERWITFGMTLSGPMAITEDDVTNMTAILNNVPTKNNNIE